MNGSCGGVSAEVEPLMKKNKNFLTLLKGLYHQILSICRIYFHLETGLQILFQASLTVSEFCQRFLLAIAPMLISHTKAIKN